MPPNPLFQVGDLLHHRYLLQQPLGQAGIRQTWLALDLASHSFGWLWRSPRLNTLPWLNTLKLLTFGRSPQWVTIKLLAFSPQLQWSDFKRFEKEADVLQTLHHPRIPRYHHRFEIPEQFGGLTWFALVQEFVPGHSLADLLAQSKTFNEAIAQKIAQDVLQILIYLQESQPPILHRDIKPSNLILGQSGETYLIDFGVAQTDSASLDMTLTIVGSSGYAPLEQYWGKAVPASDLYGLGATLIHLLSGRPPQDALQGESHLWAESLPISAGFQRWLERMTHALPEKRYLTAREALDSLQTLDQVVSERSLFSLKSKSVSANRLKRYHSEDGLALQIPSGQSHLWSQLQRSSQTAKLSWSRLGLWSLTLWSFVIVPTLMISSLLNSEKQTLFFWEFQLLCSLNILTVFILYLWDLSINHLEKTHLAFSGEQYEIIKTVLGVKFFQKQGNNQDILGVFPHPKQGFYQVSLNTKDKIYFFGKDLQANEADSLVKEIRTWLQNHPS